MISGILRQPMAILGALGLLSLAEDLLQWQQQFQTWIDAWQAFSRPAVQFLFGWLLYFWPWSPPDWSLDYLAMGTIVFCSLIRTFVVVIMPVFLEYSKEQSYSERFGMLVIGPIVWIPIVLLLWPIIVLCYPIMLYLKRETVAYNAARVFLESFIWAALIIAINSAWIASG